MTRRKITGQHIIYLPFIVFLALAIYSLYLGVTTIDDDMEQNVRVWKDALMISAILGEFGSLIVVNRFNLLLTGTTPNLVRDLREKSGPELTTMYNSLFAYVVFMPILLALNILYIHTQLRLFLILTTAFAVLWGISTIVYLFAMYLRIRRMQPQSLGCRFSDPAIFPTIISMLQIIVTREKWVLFIYRNIYTPQSEWVLTLVLILTMLYFLAAAYCHFSNVYCLFGFWFIKRDPDLIRKKLNDLQAREDQREIDLYQMAKNMDEKAERSGLLKRVLLVVRFISNHVRIYVQGRICAADYLLTTLRFRSTKRMGSLLEPDRLRINAIRFFLFAAMFELLAVDFLLFIYLESSSPCLKFFELISTVFIIPILLSWLMELKSKAKKRNESEVDAK